MQSTQLQYDSLSCTHSGEIILKYCQYLNFNHRSIYSTCNSNLIISKYTKIYFTNNITKLFLWDYLNNKSQKVAAKYMFNKQQANYI